MTPEDATYIYEALQGAQSIDAAMAFGIYIYSEDGGVLITPRMAKVLEVGIGSVMRAERLDGTVITLEVANIIDFPVGNEIYISQTALSKVSYFPFTISLLFMNARDWILAFCIMTLVLP